MPDEPVTSTETSTSTETRPTVDTEALEIGELLKAAGYSKDNVNDLTSSVESLKSLQHIIKNNPKEFLSMYERNDAEGAQNFHNVLAQEYIDRYASKDGDNKGGKESELAITVKNLQEQVNQSKAEQAARDQAAAMAQIKQRFDARVDDVLGQLPKEMNLTKSEKNAFRSQLTARLATDPSIVERCSKGNFFDVPKVFKEQLDEWTNDRTEATKAAEDARKDVGKKGLAELLSAPYMTLPTDVDMEKLQSGDDWEPNIEALADALNKI